MLETIVDKRFEILGLGTTWKSEELCGRKHVGAIHYYKAPVFQKK